MLSKRRKDARNGLLRGEALGAPPAGPAREIAQFQALEGKHAELQQEHDLLKNCPAALFAPFVGQKLFNE